MMLYLLCVAILVGVDQWIKVWAAQVLQKVDTIAIIPNVLHLTYARNDGAAFSILKGQQWLLITVTSVAILAILIALVSKRLKDRWICAAFVLIAGGGIGNLWDRIVQGFVTDYIDFRLIHYAIFNFADSCVVVGAVLLCGYILFQEFRSKKISAEAPKKVEQHDQNISDQ